MAQQSYSIDACRELTREFEKAQLARPMRIDHYDAGTELSYDVTGVSPARRATVRLAIEKFVGGGFAGQVYRVKVLAVDPACGRPAPGEQIIPGLQVGGTYAMKILIPPSRFSVRFRNFIYWLGFQAPFSLQVNPAAARSGALWQKLIRRAAAIELGSERAVVDILATFVDARLGSCGELSEWIAGRNWRFEVDDQLFHRWSWRVGDPAPGSEPNSPEFRAKKAFMAGMVRLLHTVGAHELARQYEWWTCKSQPNCLKRLDGEGDPARGLTAVDFRAGLALLPHLPMSPGDVKLIAAGIRRGSLVQFDRGNLAELRAYVAAHPDHFADMRDALAELESADAAYRESQIDVSHHHVRLLYDRKLWRGIRAGAIEGWRVRREIDEEQAERMSRSRWRTGLFALLGLLPGLGAMAVILGVLLTFGAAWSAAKAGGGWFGTLALGWPWAGGILAGAVGLLIAAVGLRRGGALSPVRKLRRVPLDAAYVVGVLAGALGIVVSLATFAARSAIEPGGWTRVLDRGWTWGLAILGGGFVAVVVGRLGRRLWGRRDYREHYGRLLTSPRYLLCTLKAKRMEAIVDWHRAGRISERQALQLKDSLPRYLLHLAIGRPLPAGLHRFFSDPEFLRGKLFYILVRPVKLYFDAAYRERWLHDMVDEGLAQGMLTDAEAQTIRGQIAEPFIQKYLKNLAVHVCTLPITQIVSVTVAIYAALRHGRTIEESWKLAVAILVAFQVVPISPGSLTRGLYGLYVVIRERNYRDYRLALWLGFWKYIGYLAFPIQMAYRYPAIARFMAGRWATGAVHVVPVFGEHGALMEHSVFDVFYNLPLTLRRRQRVRASLREGIPTRWWHVPLVVVAAFVLIAQLPTLLAYPMTAPGARAMGLIINRAAWSVALAAAVGGALAALLARGARTGRRLLIGGLTGLGVAGLQAMAVAAHPWLFEAGPKPEVAALLRTFLLALMFPAFYSTLAGIAAAAAAELLLPEPRLPESPSSRTRGRSRGAVVAAR